MNPPQIHYVLGWLIVVVAHNWPVLLALLATAAQAMRVWRSPTRRRVALLYGTALLGVAFEYHKHIAPQLQDAANYLLMFELLPLNRPISVLVGPVSSITFVVLALGFIAYALFAERHQNERGIIGSQTANCKNTRRTR